MQLTLTIVPQAQFDVKTRQQGANAYLDVPPGPGTEPGDVIDIRPSPRGFPQDPNKYRDFSGEGYDTTRPLARQSDHTVALDNTLFNPVFLDLICGSESSGLIPALEGDESSTTSE